MPAIDTSGLAKFGDMNVISLANLGDGDLVTSSRSATTSGWYGVTLTQPTRIEKIDVVGRGSLGFDSSGTAYSITLKARAKQGSAPTSKTDGELLAMQTFTDPNTNATRTLVSANQSTLFDHVWYEHTTTGGFASAAEMIPYDAPDPPPPPSFRYVTQLPTMHKRVIGPVTIPLTDSSPYDFRVVVSKFVPDVLMGDELDVKGEFQVTSENQYNVMCSSCLLLAATATEGDVTLAVIADLGPGEVIKINNHNGQNFHAAAEHHYTKSRVGVWTADQDYPEGVFLNFVIFAAGSQAGPGDFITLNSAFLWITHSRLGDVVT